MNLGVQLTTMGLMLAGGGLLGMLYDVARVFAKEFRFARLQTWIVDLCYWLVAAMIVFRLLYSGNDGELRLYVFIGLLVGGWLYFSLLSRWTAKLTVAVIQFGRRLYALIVKMLYVLIVKPIILLFHGVKLLLSFVLTVTIFFYKFMVQLSYPIQKLLQWLLRVSKLQQIWNRFMQMIRNGMNRFRKK